MYDRVLVPAGIFGIVNVTKAQSGRGVAWTLVGLGGSCCAVDEGSMQKHVSIQQ